MGVQQQQTTPVNKPKSTKPVSEARKIRKPLMERKRRERINTCLNDLASLLTEAKMVKTEPGKPSKLEKADILELTVKHIRSFKHQDNNTTQDEEEEKPKSSYKEGFTKCMGMVDQTLGKAGKEALRQRLLAHLKSCLMTLDPPKKETTAEEKSSNESKIEKAESKLKAISDNKSLPSDAEIETDKNKSEVDSKKVETKDAPQRITLVPTRLPSGGVAFVIQGGLDASLLLTQTDVTENKKDISNISSEPKAHLNCDSSISTSTAPLSPQSPPLSPRECPLPSSPTPSTSSASPSCNIPLQSPDLSAQPNSYSQRFPTDYNDSHFHTVEPIPQEFLNTQPYNVPSIEESSTVTEIHNHSTLPYMNTPMYSTQNTQMHSAPNTPVTPSYRIPSPADQHSPPQQSPPSLHVLQVPTTSYHIPAASTQPQPIPHYSNQDIHNHPHHSRHPPTPPPSISPQHSLPYHQYQYYQPVSSEEDMDTDGLSEEEIDIDVENDVPYDLSMRRIWRYW